MCLTFFQEQRISDEKFVELQQKIEEYSEMYDTEAMASQLSSKLPPIAENDSLEKEVRNYCDTAKSVLISCVVQISMSRIDCLREFRSVCKSAPV